MKQPTINEIIGELLRLDKYKFVDTRLLCDIVTETLTIQERCKNAS